MGSEWTTLKDPILTAVRIEVVGDIHECTTGNKMMTAVEERHFGGQGVILIVEGWRQRLKSSGVTITCMINVLDAQRTPFVEMETRWNMTDQQSIKYGVSVAKVDKY